MSLNLFDWNVIGQIAVLIVMLTIVLLILFVLKQAGAQANHRRELERMDHHRNGGKADGSAPQKDDPPTVD